MGNTTPTGYTAVDTPLPYAIDGRYVDEKYLTEEIDSLWASRQSYSRSIHMQKTETRGFETTMGEMLFTMKAVLSRPGRGGGWSSWLKQRGIPRASADRMVLRFAATQPPGESTHESIQAEPSEVEIGKLFAALWPRCEKVLITPRSRYDFLRCFLFRSGLIHEWRDNGILIYEPGTKPTLACLEHAVVLPSNSSPADEVFYAGMC